MKLTAIPLMFSIVGMFVIGVAAADSKVEPTVTDVAGKLVNEEINMLRQNVSIEKVEPAADDSLMDAGDKVNPRAYSGTGMNLCLTHDCAKTGGRLDDRLRIVEQRMQADLDGDGFSIAAGDCDDADPLTYPDAYDHTDGIDNNCDGLIDNGNKLAR